MKYQRNKALESAINKVLSEGAKESRELGKAGAKAGVKLGDPKLQKFGQKLFAKGSKKFAQKREQLDKEEKQKKIQSSVERAIKVVTSKRAELEKEKTSASAPSRGKASDVAASLSSKLSSKLSLPSGATEKKAEAPGIKLGVMRRPEHEAIKPASAPVFEPKPKKKKIVSVRKPSPKSFSTPEDHSKKSSEEVRSLISSGHLPIHSSSLELLRNAMKREEFTGTKHNKKAISFYNRMSQEISGSYNTHPEEPTPGLHSSRFQKALHKVKSKIGLIRNKELPVNPYKE